MNNNKRKCPDIPTITIQNPKGNYKFLSFRFKIKDTEEYYSPAPEDDVYFVLKKNFDTDKFVLKKHLNNGLFFDSETKYFYFYFTQEDTINLDFNKFVGDITIVKDKSMPEVQAYIEFYNCFSSRNKDIEGDINE